MILLKTHLKCHWLIETTYIFDLIKLVIIKWDKIINIRLIHIDKRYVHYIALELLWNITFENTRDNLKNRQTIYCCPWMFIVCIFLQSIRQYIFMQQTLQRYVWFVKYRRSVTGRDPWYRLTPRHVFKTHYVPWVNPHRRRPATPCLLAVWVVLDTALLIRWKKN